ncbi:MAG: YcxB family protein [Isosphaeraceae bacterium]
MDEKFQANGSATGDAREVLLKFDESTLKQAVRAFFLRTILRRFGFLFYAALLGLLILLTWLLANGERGWQVGFLSAFLLCVAAFFVTLYVSHYRNTIGRFRQMRNPEAILRLGEEELTLKSDLGSSTLPWSAITEVWRFPRFWLVLLSPAQFFTLPLDCLDPAAREFIDRKTAEAGPGGLSR